MRTHSWSTWGVARADPNDPMSATGSPGGSRGPWRVVLLISGTVFLAVGAAGVVIPILPTTPFLIVAAWCYARSSQRCYRWLTGNRVFGRHLCDYLQGRGVPARVKAVTLGFLWVVMGVSAAFFTDRLWLRILLGVIALAVTVHVLLIKTRYGGA